MLDKFHEWFVKHQRTIDLAFFLFYCEFVVGYCCILIYLIYTERSDKLHFGLCIFGLIMTVAIATYTIEKRIRRNRE